MGTTHGLIPDQQALLALKRRMVRDLESTIADAECLGIGDDEFVTRCRLGRDQLVAELESPASRSTQQGRSRAPLRLVAR